MKRNIELIKTEVEHVEAPPGRVVLLNGVRYMVYGVAHPGGTSRGGDLVICADMDTGRMFYRTLACFHDQMAWNVVEPTAQEEDA